MEKFYDSKMNELGYNQLITDIFYDWENVKDEILLKERKDGTGSGTVHVFLGAADSVLRQEFASYYDAVENGEEPSVGAVSVRHYFLANNVLSMIGYLCQYYQSKHKDFTSEVRSILNELNNANDESGLLTTTSLFKLSTGSNKLRPYFKQFDERGVFYRIVRHLLLPQSAYKISLYKNEEGEYAAFWLIGFDKLSDFEAHSSKSLFRENIKGRINSLQQIYYGAPGTGKSHEIKKLTKGKSVVRTTFHPDSDYSTFVGAYKPTMDNVDARVVPVVLGESGTVFNKNEGTFQEKRIVYQFVMQAFLKAYLGAWKKYAEASGDEADPQFLVIEEINRGNCAQIFGDLFQLLDRGNNGFSEYPIEADTDLQQEIEIAFKEHRDYMLSKDIDVEGVLKDYTSNYGATLSEDIQSGRVLLLPSNLYIWATMNTSDQSLFPIDSAFKRRWDWKYMPIDTKKENWYIKVGNARYSWTAFLEKVNNELLTDETAEDKHLGFYFCKAENNEIATDKFVSKVLFYLWNDVFKIYGIPAAIGSSKDWGYTKFYNPDGSVNEQRVIGLMKQLKIEAEGSVDDVANDQIKELS